MSDPEKNPPEDEYHFPEEEYHFNEEDPEMNAYDPLQAQQGAETSSASEPKLQKKWSLPDIQKLFERIKLQPVIVLLQKNFMARVASIALLVLIFGVFVYRCTSDPVAEKVVVKKTSISVTHPPAPSVSNSEVPVSTVPTVTFKPAAQTVEVQPVSMLNQDQMQRWEKANSDLQSQVRDLSSQISNLRNNVDTTTASLKLIAEQMAQLATTVGNEVKVTAGLAEQIKQQKNPFGRKNDAAAPQFQCALQAVIPGRAWLICSNGETITVNQGSRLNNYGVVRYIDAASGQILTSSGQTITFSQEDS